LIGVQESASSNGVTAMPTFILFRNKVKVDNLRGADPNALEEKIKKFYDAESEDESGVKGYVS
jgi:thioredoxin-like negative regulator of GroEL